MDQHSWNIARAKTKSVVSTQLTAAQGGEAGMEIAAAEVVMDTRAVGEDRIL